MSLNQGSWDEEILRIIWWALNAITCILIEEKKKEILHTQTHTGEGTEANTGVVQPQAKEHWQPLEAGRGRKKFSPRASRGAQLCWHLDFGPVEFVDFGLLASRTVKK